MYLKLIREPADGNSVRGVLHKVHFDPEGREFFTKICDTLENADFIIPALIYRIDVTMSPRFQRLMPILCSVPNRTGIRIHRGTRPEHSKGCILVPGSTIESYLTDMLLHCKQDREEVRLEIVQRPRTGPRPASPSRASRVP